MANQATENLFNAMDEIIQARLQSLNYDTTIKAIIVNADQAEKGIYTVAEIGAEQTNKFQAQSENTSYQLNDCVYVTIPRGDTASENKIIIGKYIEDGDAYYNYVNPMDSFLDITGNLITSLNASEWGLTANYDKEKPIVIWEAQNLNLRGFDRLALKAQFKTWLESLDICSGNYGLSLIVENTIGEFTTFALTTKEMYGNPYYYETFYAQEVLLDISAIEEIKSLSLTLFQANDFITTFGEKAPSEENGEKIPSNIFMKAPYVSVGYDISNFDGDDLRIFTSDEQSYNGKDSVGEEKTIEAKWIHVAEGVSAVVVDDTVEIPRNPEYDGNDTGRYPQPATKADIRWFQYDSTYIASVSKAIKELEEDLKILNERLETIEEDDPDYAQSVSQKAQVEEEMARLQLLLSERNARAEQANRYTGYKSADKNWVEIESTLDENFLPTNQFNYTFITPTNDITTPALRFKAVVSVPSERYVNAQFALTDEFKRIANNDNASATYEECQDVLYDVMDGTMTLNAGKSKINRLRSENSGEVSDEEYGDLITALTAYTQARSEIKHIISQELVFPNLGYYPEEYTDNTIVDLQIIVDPGGLKGQYLIYEDSGLITNTAEADQTRYCEAVYRTLAGILHESSSSEDFLYEIDNSEVITWYIPLESTMLATPVQGIEYSEYDTQEIIEVKDANNDVGLPLGKYCMIERRPQRDKTEVDEEALIAEHHMYARQNFRIKDYYTQMETNNFIYCRVVKGEGVAKAMANMVFGVAGTNGTDATFLLRLYEIDEDGASKSDIPASALSITTYRYSEDNEHRIVSELTQPGALIVVPELYDYNNNLMEGYFTELTDGGTVAHPVTYKFVNYSEFPAQPFSLTPHNSGAQNMILEWAGVTAEEGFNKSGQDFYLVIEAEVPYKIVYEFETYTQEDIDNDPILQDLGKVAGDYKLDDEGNKIPTGNTRDDKLKTYLPIPMVKKKLLKRTQKIDNPTIEPRENDINPKEYQRQVIGANRVIYDRNGANAKYYKDPYQLLDGILEEVPNMTWSARIRASDGKEGAEARSIESFYPTVTPSGLLQPLEMYILGNSIAENFCVYGKDEHGEILCVMPVLIMQNKYGSSMLNKWDGGLTIDEKNGTILASMVGAGIKDVNNTFSGVLMGDITQAFNDNHNGLGLYGFHQSDQSFGFNIDGTAFIGKAGHGRIWFDGNNGTISSGAYSDGISPSFKYLGTGHNGEDPVIRPQQGMEIDLDGSDGISSSLKMFGPMGGFVVDTKERQMDDYWKNDKKIHIPTENDPDPRTITFKLFTGIYKNKEVPDTSKGEFKNTSLPYERGMIYFDNDGQYIQSTNYDGKYNITGTHTTRLNALKPIGKNVEIKFGEYPAGLNGQTIPPGWNVWELNNKGKVKEEPVNYNDTPAQQGSFIDLQNGWIDMRNGIVGGWQISKDMIASRLGEVIMWSGDPSDNSDTGVPFIRLGAIKDKEMKGKLWIADYRILGKTVIESVATQTVTAGTLDLNNIDFEDFDTGGDTAEKVELITLATTSITPGSFSTNALNSWHLYDDSDDNSSLKLGVILETAQGSSSLGSSLIVWRPTYSGSSTVTSLGTMSYPWGSIFANNGIFFKESFTGFDGSNNDGWHLVATQDWVVKVITMALNQRIKEVNNLASKALKRANAAISDIMSWCEQFDQKKFVTDFVEVERKNGTRLKYNLTTVTAKRTAKGYLTGEVSMGVETVDADFDGDDIVVGSSYAAGLVSYLGGAISYSAINGISFAIERAVTMASTHYHIITVEADGGSLTATSSATTEKTAATACEIFSSDNMSFSESGGTITLSVTVAGATSTKTFNMAATKFHTDAVAAAYAKGKSDATCTRYHAGSTREVNGVTQTLTWV